MKNEFVPYEEALTMKELGFDEKCFGFYNPTITKDVIINNDSYGGFGLTQDHIVVAPTFSQAFRWFREKYKLFGEVCLTTKQEDCEVFEFFVLNVNEPIFESDDYTVFENHTHIFPLSIVTQTTTLFITFLMGCMI